MSRDNLPGNSDGSIGSGTGKVINEPGLIEVLSSTNVGPGSEQPLQSAVGSGGLSRLQLPQNQEQTDHFITFRISKKYEYKNRSVSEPEVSIDLPLPQSLQTGYKANYNNAELGPIGDIIAKGANESDGTIGSVINKSLSGLTASFSKATAANMAVNVLNQEGAALIGGLIGNRLGGALGGIAAGAGTAAGQGAIQGAQAGLGIARNPHMAVMFSGPDFRSHSFQYKFVPKNKAEQNELANIISAFKQAMLPEFVKSKQFFRYPRNIDVLIPLGDPSGRNPYFFSIASSVLEDFTVDYQPDGPYFHEVDGRLAPVAVAFNMTLRETTMTTRETVQRYTGDASGASLNNQNIKERLKGENR